MGDEVLESYLVEGDGKYHHHAAHVFRVDGALDGREGYQACIMRGVYEPADLERVARDDNIFWDPRNSGASHFAGLDLARASLEQEVAANNGSLRRLE